MSPGTVSRIRPYIVSAVAGLEETGSGEEHGDQQILTGLHAKFYVVERANRAHLLLGSANATDAAFGGNAEILVELVGGGTKLGAKTFLDEDSPFRAILEPYNTGGGSTPEPTDEARRALDNLVRDLATVPHAITVTGPDEAGYDLPATTSERLRTPDGYTVTLELLTRRGDARHLTYGEASDVTYPHVPLPDITPFLALRATSPEGLHRGTVLRAELVNDPSGRLDEVLSRQVNTPEKFLRFLALLRGLGNPYLLSLLTGGGDGNGPQARVGMTPGILELVLRALAEHPDAIADLDRLVPRLQLTEQGRAVLPDGFDTFWPVVIAAYSSFPRAGAR